MTDSDQPADALVATRRSLHAVAESVVAGPQYRAKGTIRLQSRPGGFVGLALPIGVDGGDLVWPEGRARLSGTCRQLAAAAGIDAGPPESLYHDHAELGPDDLLHVDPAQADLISAWFALGDAALRDLGTDESPVLWPEHFDLSVAAGDVTYGVSPGDAAYPVLYAYASPWTKRSEAFWNAPFGAMRPASELSGLDALVEFFTTARRTAACGT